jgi:ribosomal protein S18 acetylase RimI-like enzyme
MLDGRKPLPEIVMGTPADAPAMERTLAAAFIDDPALSWIIPSREERLRRYPAFFRQAVRWDLAHEFALRSSDGAGVTLWRHPGDAKAGLGETLASLPGYLGALVGRLPRALMVSETIGAHLPKDFAFVYLHYAGVAPERQGRGLAGAAIRAGQARAKALGLPVHLETATESNVGIYVRLGFEVTGEYDVRGGGPHFWSMLWRGNV